ncbi:hypothetical protein D3C78_904820 [compost metagenome]
MRQRRAYVGDAASGRFTGQIGAGRHQRLAEGAAQRLHLRMRRHSNRQGIELAGEPGRRRGTGGHDPGEGTRPASLYSGKLIGTELAQIDVILQLRQIGGNQDQPLLHRTLLDGQQTLHGRL